MRRPLYLIPNTSKASQQGYALFIVLMIMIVIALLVVTALQSYNTEQRISTNDADRKMATSLAEAALRTGENAILDFEGKKVVFTNDCKGEIGKASFDGLCAAPNAVVASTNMDYIETDASASGNAWERKDKKDNKLYIDKNGHPVSNIKPEDVKKNPVYIIEYISTDSTQGSTIYRVTAKAWGKNENTVVMLQSYVSNE